MEETYLVIRFDGEYSASRFVISVSKATLAYWLLPRFCTDLIIS